MEIIYDILFRYFMNQTTNEEKLLIHEWLEKDENNKKEFIKERARFDAVSLMNEEKKEVDDEKTTSKVFVSMWIRYAMSVAATVLVMLLGFHLYNDKQKAEMGKINQTIEVPAGNYSTKIILSDGTKVWLNANSVFKYPQSFTGKKRIVELDGEAYFEVAKDAKKTFIVQTKKYDIEALGTKFNVEAYTSSDVFKTILYEGKVRVANKAEFMILQPNQTALYDKGKLYLLNEADKNSVQWKNGIIYINNISFEHVMKLFEKYYDKHIVINNNKVKESSYKGKFRISDGIEHALHVLQKDYPFIYKIENETNIYID
ncbi:MAG: FecR family protein [Phocaeicola sp.]|uniref:FecR family protein n=1 Tax=Phocaeicola TaxID=909656 RepID=UPI00234F8CCF|nr:FecR family protein [Phocaeicola oris]MCE2617383.1 FecR family protein [Phocaeicola oris]